MGLEAVSELDLRRWAMFGSATASYLRWSLLPNLSAPPDEPPAADVLEPLRWFLERVGDTVPLTQKLNLGRAFVLETDDRYHWYPANDFGWRPRREADLRELLFIHALAKRLRGVRREGRKLKLTRRGAALISDPAGLWEQTVRALASAGGFEGDLTETVLAVLLGSGPSEMTNRELESITSDVLRASWHIDDELDVPEPGILPMFWLEVSDLRAGLAAVGFLEVRDDDEQEEFRQILRLTPAGRSTAVAVLRQRARGL